MQAKRQCLSVNCTVEDNKRLFEARIWDKEAAEGRLPPASFVFTESRKSWRSLRLIDE